MEGNRIAIIEDHALVRQSLTALIHTTTDRHVVLEAGDGLEFEQACTGVAIDIALVDLNMPVRDGFETIAWIVEHRPDILPVAFSMEVDPRIVRRALEAGSRGYLPKNTDQHELRNAFHQLRTTGYYNSPLVQPHREAMERDRRIREHVVANLTARELDVLRLLCHPDAPQGKEIAHLLKISPRTVETHTETLCTKLGARGRVGLVIKAIKWGIVKV